MLFGVLGINHKLADVKLREILAKTCQRRFGAGQSLHGSHFFVLLSTCNRTEIYFSSKDLALTHSYILSILKHDIFIDFDQKLYSYFGFDCFLHLSKVTAGLDSAILGETEIQGQVKLAYESTRSLLSLPKELHFLFQKVLKIGKKVRLLMPLKISAPKIEEAVLKASEKHFENLKSIKILFIGASLINEKIIQYFLSKNIKNITLCNRSLKSALKIEKERGLSHLPWERLEECLHYDLILCATRSPEFLITNHLKFRKNIHHKLIIDLSLPRNIDPEIEGNPFIKLLNIDQINEEVIHLTENSYRKLTEVEEIIAQETKQKFIHFKEKEIKINDSYRERDRIINMVTA